MTQPNPMLPCIEHRGILHTLSWTVALTLPCLLIDEAVTRHFLGGTWRFVYKTGTFVEYLGGYHVQPLILLILLSFPNWKKVMLGYGTVMVGQALISGSIKFVVGRARPSLESGAFQFDPFNSLKGSFESFPSGDAAAAMALATLLGMYFPRSRGGFLLLGALACFGRLVKGRHFPTDVVFGAGLGIALALWVHARLGSVYFDPGWNRGSAR